MNAAKTIGILLIVLGVLGIVGLTGALGSDIPNPLSDLTTKDGYVVACQVNIDKDSINGLACAKTEECIVPKFGIFGLLDTDRNLQLSALGKTYASEEVEVSVLGVNKQVGLDGCVPKVAPTVTVILYNDEGGKLAEKQYTP